MEIKGILFDKDGTLIDFYEVWGKAVTPVMIRILGMYGLEEDDKLLALVLERMGVHGNRIDPEGSLAWKSYDMIAAEIADEIRAYYNECQVNQEDIRQNLIDYFYEEINEKSTSFPVFTNLIHLMTELKKQNIQVGVATTDEMKATIDCMKIIGIDQHISFYGTAGCNLPVKPDKELLFQASKQWQIEPQQIAVVGDTPNDMRFAQNAGAIGIGVLSGTGKKEDLLENAEFLVNSVDDLLPLIKQINQRN